MICSTPGVTVSILLLFLRHNYINGVSIFQFFFILVSPFYFFQLSINSILFFHIVKGYLSNFIIFI